MSASEGGATERRYLGGLGAALPPDTWRRLTALGTFRAYKAGHVLMDQNERSRHVLVLLRGRVKISRFDEDGYKLVLAVRSAGEVIGEFGSLGQDRRSAEVRASTACEVRVIQGDEFSRFVESDGLSAAISQHIGRRLLEEERLRHISRTHPVALRVARGLLHFARLALGVDPDDNVADRLGSVEIWLDQNDLSTALGVARPTINTTLARLRRAGIIETARGLVTVVDLRALVEQSRRPST